MSSFVRHVIIKGEGGISRLHPFRLSLWAVLCWVLLAAAPSFAAPSPDALYGQAKREMAELARDQKRSQWREPWLQLAERFETLYTTNRQWTNRTAALYRSAEALGELASRSYLPADMQKAIERYEKVAGHKASPLADDALYRAARLAWSFKDRATALRLLDALEKRFPKGDMAGDGRHLAASIRQREAESSPAEPAAQPAKQQREKAAEPESRDRAATRQMVSASGGKLTQVQWTSRKNSATITFECDKITDYVVRSQPADERMGRSSRLVVELHGVTPGTQVKPGTRVTGSLLSRVRIDSTAPGATRIYLDFEQLKRFTVSSQTSPFRLVVTAAATDAALPSGKKVGQTVQSIASPGKAGVTVPSDIAAQLGLSMGTVVIDPGHGGSDPGTDHNDILERDIALDMSRRLGKMLERYGIKVRYTRTANEKVTLESRARLANEAKGDLFVSLHLNANASESINGFETYFLDFASSSSAARLAGVENALSDRKLGDLEGILADLMLGARTQESRRIAEAIQKSVMANVRKRNYTVRDGGVRSAPFHVLLGSGMPGVLVEIGYCTNKAEAKKLKQPAYRDALAEGIASGILSYSRKLDTAGKR